MNRSLVLAVAGAAAVAGSTGLGARTASADTSYPTVTANINLTDGNKSPVRDDAQPIVTVDPNDSHNIVVAEGDFRSGTCLLHVSTDGGATFTTAKLSPTPPQFEHCTPNAGANAFPMAWAKDGSLLVAEHAFNGTATVFSGPVNVVVSRTSNFGNDWQYVVARRNGPNATPEPSAAPPTPQLQPSENASPSPSASGSTTPAPPSPEGVFGMYMASDGKGDVVVSWVARNITVPGVSASEGRGEIAVSTDDGKTFGSPIDIEGLTASTLPTNRGPALAFAPDGTLYIVLTQRGAPKGAPTTDKPSLMMYRTSDLGKTFQKAAVEVQTDFTSYPAIAISPGGGGVGYSVATVFEELSDDPVAKGQQVRDIMSSRSTDGGQTFSPPKRVTDDPIATTLANKFVPGISAAPNGRLDAAWADFRDDDGHLTSNTYYASSTDGGATWSKNMRISDKGSNRHYGQFANYSDVRGPVGIASDNYGAYVTWDDTRNAADATPVQDVYFAAVQHAALPVSSGYNVLRVVGAIIGGLLVTGVALTGAALLFRRRRPSEPPVTAGA